MFKFIGKLKYFKYNKILIIFILLCSNTFVFADNEEFDENNIDFPELVMASVSSVEEPIINSRSAIVYERNSKEILYGKNENKKVKMASTTKIMTATIVIENANLTDTVTVSKKAAGIGGSRLGLKNGDKITVKDLLYGLMLCSGNDTAVCLAEYVGGNLEGFSDLMNNKAKELNLTNTHFVTPHGLDNEEHYTTARELAIITNYALKNDEFAKIVATKNYTVTISGKSKNINNTNELLGNLEGIYGVKTGFTNGANRCLVTACKRENLDIITIVLSADTKKDRTQDSVKLINYAVNNFKELDLKDRIEEEFKNWKNEPSNRITVEKGNEEYAKSTIKMPQTTKITIRKSKEENIQIKINIIKHIQAPVEKEKILGNIIISVEDEVKMQINIVNQEEIRKKNTLDYIKRFLINYV